MLKVVILEPGTVISSVIPTTQEAEIRRNTVPSQSSK
jgi:hypothetical protein